MHMLVTSSNMQTENPRHVTHGAWPIAQHAVLMQLMGKEGSVKNYKMKNAGKNELMPWKSCRISIK